MTQNATESQTDIVWKWSSRNQVWSADLPYWSAKSPLPNNRMRRLKVKVKRNENANEHWVENGVLSNLYEINVVLGRRVVDLKRYNTYAFPSTVGMAIGYFARNLTTLLEKHQGNIDKAVLKLMHDFYYAAEDEIYWLPDIGDFYLRLGKNATTEELQYATDREMTRGWMSFDA